MREDSLKLSDSELSSLAWRAKKLYLEGYPSEEDPAVGDYVVEISNRDKDPNSVGVLVARGMAPEHEPPVPDEDGHIHMRYVWDIRPLSGRKGNGVDGSYRWENAHFVKLDLRLVSFLKLAGVISW